uniref:Uncharacterized protein n=1 Tax=Heterosigma akashiwo TaxID=2829 RepID=A0A7S3XX32_HETAK
MIWIMISNLLAFVVSHYCPFCTHGHGVEDTLEIPTFDEELAKDNSSPFQRLEVATAKYDTTGDGTEVAFPPVDIPSYYTKMLDRCDHGVYSSLHFKDCMCGCEPWMKSVGYTKMICEYQTFEEATAELLSEHESPFSCVSEHLCPTETRTWLDDLYSCLWGTARHLYEATGICSAVAGSELGLTPAAPASDLVDPALLITLSADDYDTAPPADIVDEYLGDFCTEYSSDFNCNSDAECPKDMKCVCPLLKTSRKLRGEAGNTYISASHGYEEDSDGEPLCLCSIF